MPKAKGSYWVKFHRNGKAKIATFDSWDGLSGKIESLERSGIDASDWGSLH